MKPSDSGFYFLLPWRRCRSAELPGLQPPGVAPAAGADVLLVAPVVGLHHGVQTQPALPQRPPARLGRRSAPWEAREAVRGGSAVVQLLDGFIRDGLS